MRTTSLTLTLAVCLGAVCAQYMPSRQSAGYGGDQSGSSGYGASGMQGAGYSQFGSGSRPLSGAAGAGGAGNGYGYSSAYQDNSYNSGSGSGLSGGSAGYSSGSGMYGGSGSSGLQGAQGGSSGRGMDNGNPLNRLNLNYLGPRPDYCKRPTGQFSVPNDCTSFYNCHENIAWIQKCPEGLGFNEQTYQCDYAEATGCQAAAAAAAAASARLQQQQSSGYSNYGSSSGTGYSAGSGGSGGSGYGSNYASQGQSQGYSGGGSSGYASGSGGDGHSQQQQQGGQYGSSGGQGYSAPMYSMYASAGAGAGDNQGLSNGSAGGYGRNEASANYRSSPSQPHVRSMGFAMNEGRGMDSSYNQAASGTWPQMQMAPSEAQQPDRDTTEIQLQDPYHANSLNSGPTNAAPSDNRAPAAPPGSLACPEGPVRSPNQPEGHTKEQLAFANNNDVNAGPGTVVFDASGPKEQPAACHPCQRPQAACPARPQARCFDDVCGGCRARFFERRPTTNATTNPWMEVTEQCAGAGAGAGAALQPSAPTR